MWPDPLTGMGMLLYRAFWSCSHYCSLQPRSVGDATWPIPGSRLTTREVSASAAPVHQGWRVGAPSCDLARPPAAVHAPLALLCLALSGPGQCSNLPMHQGLG